MHIYQLSNQDSIDLPSNTSAIRSHACPSPYGLHAHDFYSHSIL